MGFYIKMWQFDSFSIGNAELTATLPTHLTVLPKLIAAVVCCRRVWRARASNFYRWPQRALQSLHDGLKSVSGYDAKNRYYEAQIHAGMFKRNEYCTVIRSMLLKF